MLTTPHGVGSGLVSSDPTGDTMVAGLLAAHSAGYDIEVYLAAIAAGVTHEEICDLVGWGVIPPLGTYASMRANGLTHAQIRGYAERACGLAELERFAATQVDDTTFEEVIDYLDAIMQTVGQQAPTLRLYVSCRKRRATHRQIMQLHKLGISVGSFALMLAVGGTYDEILDAHSKGCRIRRYAKARQNGWDHDDAVHRVLL
jgi:hypothetical protein